MLSKQAIACRSIIPYQHAADVVQLSTMMEKKVYRTINNTILSFSFVYFKNNVEIKSLRPISDSKQLVFVIPN